MSTLVLLCALLAVLKGSVAAVPSQRVAVVRNGGTYFAFKSGSGDSLVMATSKDSASWSSWTYPVNSALSVTSNPVAVTGYVTSLKGYLVMVFVQTTDGQVTALVQNSSDSSVFESHVLTTNLPVNLAASHQSHDPVQAVSNKNQTILFVRTLTNTSQVYWIKFKDLLDFGTRKWGQVSHSGDNHVAYDHFGAVNTFLDRIELFAVFDSGYVMHTWQDSAETFHGNWQKLGGAFSPKFNSAPVVHQMTHSDFNGVLNLYVRGTDGNLHHIAQTTCDKVNNAWGPCTWTVYYKLGGGPVPADHALENPFVASHSFHGGIEIFTVGEKEGHLYHLWQRERDGSYSSWQNLGPLSSSSPFTSTPAIVMDDIGWWVAYALDSTQSVVKFLEKPIKFVLSSEQVQYDRNVSVTWAIPDDQATHMDWIGVYAHGAASHEYLDYSYVGGSQNPLKDPVPQGTLNFTLILPTGQYDIRYMVNKAYVASLQSSTSVSGKPSKENWVFFFDGLSRGLGGFNTNVTKCVDDGDKTIEKFKQGFTYFEDRKIFEGLHAMADGLVDFKDALVQCNETILIKDLTKFIADLVACTEDDCAQFAIDLGLELIILYEHIYEIYGDIQGARNNFKIESYEQGGFCVGRVTSACLTLE